MVNIALSVTQLTTANVRSTVLQTPYRRAETPLLRRLDSEYMTFASSSTVLHSMITLHHRFSPSDVPYHSPDDRGTITKFGCVS